MIERSSKKHCLVYANCQGHYMGRLSRTVRDFRARYTLEYLQNYGDAVLSDEQLARCDVFIYQHLEDNNDVRASSVVLERLKRLSPHAELVSIPNVQFTGYWPFHDRHSPISVRDGNYGDSLLDEILQSNPTPEAAMALYLNMLERLDYTSIFDESVAFQENRERDLTIRAVPFYKDKLRSQKMFYSFIHPSHEQLVDLTNALLAHLGCEPLYDAVTRSALPNMAFVEIPIAPVVGRKMGLTFLKPGQRYRCYGLHLTFEEYLYHYVTCALHCKGTQQGDLFYYLSSLREHLLHTGKTEHVCPIDPN